MVSYFPVGYTPTGSNDAGTGIGLGMVFRPTTDTAIDRIHTPLASTTIAKARIYSVSGGGLGDGTLKVDLTTETTDSNGDLIFDDIVTLTAGVSYIVMALLATPQTWGSVNNGGEALNQPPFNTINHFWGVYVAETSLPATANISVGNTIDAPFNQTQNYYGIGVGYSALPSKVTCHAERVSDTAVDFHWTMPGDAPDGITVFRAAGARVIDGNGRQPSNPAYDPATVPGSVTLAQGITGTPYHDTGLTPGTYTYWAARTDEVD